MSNRCRTSIFWIGSQVKPQPGFGKKRSRDGLRLCWRHLRDDVFQREGWLFEPKPDGTASAVLFSAGAAN